MQAQIMAQFLIKGDVIQIGKAKRKILASSTNGDITTVSYEDLNGNAQLVRCPKNQFLKVINEGRL